MGSRSGDDAFRVAAFQGTVTERDPDASLGKACEALAWADERDAHVLCMPESYLQGYFDTFDEAYGHSIDLESSEFADVCSRVSQYNATLVLGLNERRGKELYNTAVVIEGGRFLGKYSKAYLVKNYFTPGCEFPVFERDGVTFGVIICADSSYVEPSRILAMRGAQVIFSPHFNRMPHENVDNHVRRVRSHHIARAVENECWVVRSNIIWPHQAEKVGMGDSFIVNRLGEFVCEAGLLTEKMLFHAIPRDDLATGKRKFHRTLPAVAEVLTAEYGKLGQPSV